MPEQRLSIDLYVDNPTEMEQAAMPQNSHTPGGYTQLMGEKIRVHQCMEGAILVCSNHEEKGHPVVDYTTVGDFTTPTLLSVIRCIEDRILPSLKAQATEVLKQQEDLTPAELRALLERFFTQEGEESDGDA